MALEAKIVDTGKIIRATEYDPLKHKGRIVDKLLNLPMSRVQQFFRKGNPVQPHFRIQQCLKDWPDDVIFDPEYFKQFTLEGHTLTWPNGADFAPEHLHDLLPQIKTA